MLTGKIRIYSKRQRMLYYSLNVASLISHAGINYYNIDSSDSDYLLIGLRVEPFIASSVLITLV
jgi:hypothetical protein